MFLSDYKSNFHFGYVLKNIDLRYIDKKEIDKLFDLDEASYTKLLQFSRKVAIAIEKAIDCKRVGMTVIGLEVPHAHVHLIPLNTMDNARFIEKVKLSPEEFEATAKAINSYL